MKRAVTSIVAVLLLASGCRSPEAAERSSPSGVAGRPEGDARIVTIASPSPLVHLKLMLRAGSTSDPPGKEGLALLTAESLIEGGFGSSKSPITKERLGEMVRPWGEGAMPSAQVSSDTTTFHFTVPREVLPEYLALVLLPMLAVPHFSDAEIERLKGEMASAIPSARHEGLEELGLAVLDGYVLEGTGYEHPAFGTETSIPKLSRDDVLAFFRDHYRRWNAIVGISKDDPDVLSAVAAVVNVLPGFTEAPPAVPRRSPAAFKGRHAVVVEEPSAPAASIHLGFPIEVTRDDPDYWPLLVACTWLGAHRDSFSHLYALFREERGYNYGDYAYIEFWDGRTGSLFPIFNQPRPVQYFSIWLRPVQHEYARHLLKAATCELERLIREGLTPEEVEAAKRKAKVVYLSLAGSVDRLVADAVDSAYLGLGRPYLSTYLEAIDRVTPEAVNAAVREHLQAEDIKYVVVTDSKHAKDLAEAIREDDPAFGKGAKEYGFEEVKLPDGKTDWKVPPEKVEMLKADALWAHHPLRALDVRLVPVSEIFKDGRWAGGASGR